MKCNNENELDRLALNNLPDLNQTIIDNEEIYSIADHQASGLLSARTNLTSRSIIK